MAHVVGLGLNIKAFYRKGWVGLQLMLVSAALSTVVAF